MVKSTSEHQVKITAVDQVTKVISGVHGSFKSLGALIGGSAVAGAIISAAKASLEFEKGLAKVSTLLPATSRNMSALGEGLLRIRASGAAASLSELNEGLYQAISAGVSAGSAIEFMDVASRSAKAGFTDIATAVDGITTVLNAYGLSAEHATEVADIMFVTQNRGKTTFGELASAYGRVLPLASALGLSFEEVSAAMQSLTLQGINTNEAVTGLRAILAGFVRQGDGAVVTSQGLAGALNDLYEKTGGNTTEIQKYLGGVEALTPALALMGDKAALLSDNLKATESAAGTAADAYAAFTNTTAAELEKLAGALDVAKVKAGEGLVQGLNDGAKSAANLSSEIVKVGEALGFVGGQVLESLAKTFEFERRKWEIVVSMFIGLPDSKKPHRNPNPSPLDYSRMMGPFPANSPLYSIGPTITPEQQAAYDQLVIKNAKILSAIEDQNKALKKQAKLVARQRYEGPSLSGSQWGDGRALITPIGSNGSGIGMQLGRGQSGLGGGDPILDTMFGAGGPPVIPLQFEVPDNSLEQIDKLNKRIQNIASGFQYVMSSVMQTIVQGAMQGSLRIKDVFNALKAAVLSILAELAARAAVAGILSLIFPGLGFSGAMAGLSSGNFVGGGANSIGRGGPIVGASPGLGSFGVRPVIVHNYNIAGSLVTREQIAREIINIGVRQGVRGQNNLIRY